jgi:hypothetical protein
MRSARQGCCRRSSGVTPTTITGPPAPELSASMPVDLSVASGTAATS